MNNKHGFTLIELLLVVMVIGFMLAVIVPRGLRATTDAKYNLVRQNCAELASFGNDWIEQQMLAQDADSNATRVNYLDSLVSDGSGVTNSTWIAIDGFSNWNNIQPNLNVIWGRKLGGILDITPDNTVEDIIDPAKIPRNPFNGASIFVKSNDPSLPGVTGPIPGAIACARAADSSTGGTFDYYAFIFQGTDSTLIGPAPLSDFHGGMDPSSLAGVREGVFFTKVRQ